MEKIKYEVEGAFSKTWCIYQSKRIGSVGCYSLCAYYGGCSDCVGNEVQCRYAEVERLTCNNGVKCSYIEGKDISLEDCFNCDYSLVIDKVTNIVACDYISRHKKEENKSNKKELKYESVIC